MQFELISSIRDVQVIAGGRGVRIEPWLREQFGGRRWRKLKGIATIRDMMGEVYEAEIHWFEAHGVGKRLLRVKRRIG